MRLAHEFIRLPLRFDAEELAIEVAALDHSFWRPHPEGHPGNDALPLVASNGDPSDDSTHGPMLPTPALARCPKLQQVLASFGTVVGRTRLMRLAGNAEATPHVDVNQYWVDRARVHVPIVTQPGVRFVCGGREAHMAAGEAWIFDTGEQHNVVNDGVAERIHLVSDTEGSPAFWALVGRGEPNPVMPGAAPLVPLDGVSPVLSFEGERRPDVLRRPIFVISAPRSGSTLLFETLAQSPDVMTIGGESHQVLEDGTGLHPSERGWSSNRLTAADVTPALVAELTGRFLDGAVDRDGQPPADGLVLLEKTPKNALRVPFLAAAYPDARFVFLYRDPLDTVASMLEAWRSGRFTTYPELPDWDGPPWSLVLVPGWEELRGRPLVEVVTAQWRRIVELALDDLEALAPGRVCLASHGRLVQEPQAEVARICGFLEIGWDRDLTAPLPASRTTLTPPEPPGAKAARMAADLVDVGARTDATAERARQLFARPPRKVAPLPARPPLTQEELAAGFTSKATSTFAQLLGQLGASVLITTYQTGRLILVREDGGKLNTHFRAFDLPMGVAVDRGRLVIGTRREVWDYRDQPAVARKLEPAGKHDACYLPRASHVTGDVRIHDLAVAGGEVWLVNTLFSCLATIEPDSSFVPRWRPPFVSALAPEDRCHLNGLAVRDDRPAFVTAFGVMDTPGGWREVKSYGGVVLEVPSGEVVASGLCMPHSPRWHDGRLWVLESGKGSLGVVDLDTGAVETVAQLPGFTRGLSFAGPYAFVGLSQVRETLFEGVPIVEAGDRACGVWVVDTRSGATVAFLRFEGMVQELFDVHVLPHRFPDIQEPGSDLVGSSYVLPPEALADVPAERRD